MNRRISAFVVCVLSAFVAGGCKDKDPEPMAIPVSSAPAAGTVAADPAPSGSAAAMAPATAATTAAAPTDVAPVATTAAPVRQASIDACCSALSAIKSSGKSSTTKAKAAAAAAVCSPIAKRVKSGETSRAAALTQIKSAMVGTEVPGECR